MQQTNSKEFETIVLIQESYGLPKGTLGVNGGMVIDSGHYMVEFVVMDDDYHSFMKKNNFKSIQEYIEYQEKENVFGAQYWKNPFNTIRVYPEIVLSQSDIEKRKNEAKEKLSMIQKELTLYNEYANLLAQ